MRSGGHRSITHRKRSSKIMMRVLAFSLKCVGLTLLVISIAHHYRFTSFADIRDQFFPPPTVADQRFTPPHIYSDASLNKLHERWLRGQFSAMGEPSLWELSKNGDTATVYRLLQLPSFTPAVGARLVVQADGSGKMIVTKLDGNGSFRPGHPIEKRTTILRVQQVQKFEKLLRNVGFWSNRIGASERTDGKRIPRCTDGVSYVFEGKTANNYKMVVRHVCSLEDEVFALLKELSELSSIPEPIRFDP